MLNNIKVLLGILIIVAGFAYIATSEDKSSSTTEQRSLMVDWQGSDDRIAAVTSVNLSQDGEELVIEKTAEQWVLNGGFFVNIDPLFQLLQSLKNAEIVESKTTNPEKHAQLELADDDLKVTVVRGSAAPEVIHIGKQSTSGLTFVRYGGDNQTYVAKGIESVTFNEDSWRLKTILDYAADQVVAARVHPIDGDEIVVQRNEINELVLLSIPVDAELKTDAYLDQLVSGLSRLMVDEALPVAVEGMALKLTNSYTLLDGSEVLIKVFQQGEDYFLTVDADNYPHYQGWMMKIAEYKFTALNRQLSEFIQVKQAAEEASEGETDVEPAVE